MNKSTSLSLFVISLSVLYGFTLPLWDKTGIIVEEKSRYSDLLIKIDQINSKKEIFLNEFKSLDQDNIDIIDTLIPNSLNFVKLISDIDNVAAKYGIALNKVDLIEDNSNPASVAEVDSLGYSSSTITLEFSASYEKFNLFINDLERSLRILDIKSVQLSANTPSVYEYKISLDTYWIK